MTSIVENNNKKLFCALEPKVAEMKVYFNLFLT